MDFMEFTAKTVNDAITEACEKLVVPGERLEYEVGIDSSKEHTFICGDSKTELKKLETSYFDFMVTSPPYWSILNKKADYKVKKERLSLPTDTCLIRVW